MWFVIIYRYCHNITIFSKFLFEKLFHYITLFVGNGYFHDCWSCERLLQGQGVPARQTGATTRIFVPHLWCSHGWKRLQKPSSWYYCFHCATDNIKRSVRYGMCKPTRICQQENSSFLFLVFKKNHVPSLTDVNVEYKTCHAVVQVFP